MKGYSLLELIVTLMLVMLLTGVGVAGYSVFERNISDRDARGNVDRVVLAERNWAARNAAWTDEIDDLSAGRGLTLTKGVSTSSRVVSIAVRDGVELGVAALSESGECQGKLLGDPLDDAGSETWVSLPNASPCSGDAVLANS